MTDHAPIVKTHSTCCYCGTGCGVIIHSQNDKIIGVEGDPDHPANFGRLCTKGNTLHLAVVNTGRGSEPMLRTERTGQKNAVSWDEALTTAAHRFAEIIRTHGPDAVAFYVSGQLLTEDYYVFNKLARALIGTNNIDSNSRLCMSSAVAAYKATLGSDAMPCCYEDIDLTDLMLITGANPAFAHPILFRRIEAARAANPNLKIIVIDPRRTDTAAEANLHIAITPGTDVLLYSAMLHVLMRESLIDERFIAEHTTGFDALRGQVAELSPEAVAERCGVAAKDIETAARWFGKAKAPLSFWCQGLNQSTHGTHNGAALIHLHLATGTLGKPGMGPFSLTGQPNAMGGREAGAMANLLPGHRNLASAEDRAELAELWNAPTLPEVPGKTAVELFEAVREGSIKAVWITCTNPVQSMPDAPHIREALEKAEFVVVQDAWADTETAAFADLFLPATTWGEKEGTVTNSERRISRVRAAVSAPNEVRQDWRIARDFALKLGRKLNRPDTDIAFAFPTVADVYAEHVSTTQGRDLDIGALSHAFIDQNGPQQWPCPKGATQGTPRLFTDYRFATPDGKARFVPISTSLTAEVPDALYPYRLVTGRLRDQWHGMSRTGRIPRLFAHEPEPNIKLHPSDLAARDWQDGQLLSISNRRGTIVLPVSASEDVRVGQAFVAMHWGRRSLSHDGVNALTIPAFDPISKQPELKHTAVRIEAAKLPWRLVALRSAGSRAEAQEQSLHWRAALEPMLGDFAFASLTLDGRERPLVALRLAAKEALPQETIEKIAAALDLQDTRCLHYQDKARSILKRARIEDNRLTGILLAGEEAAAPWLRAALRDGIEIEALRRWLFAPYATAPVDSAAPRRVVCNCLDVSADEIETEIKAGLALPQIQEKLKCGTSCGSCMTEVRRMIASHGGKNG